MKLLTAETRYVDPNWDVTIETRQATALDDMRRSILIGHEQGKMGIGKEANSPDYLEHVARWNTMIVWAGCRVTLERVTHNDPEKPNRITEGMTLEEFNTYPAALVQLWEADVMRLNPQWMPDALGGEIGPVEQKNASPAN